MKAEASREIVGPGRLAEACDEKDKGQARKGMHQDSWRAKERRSHFNVQARRQRETAQSTSGAFGNSSISSFPAGK